MSWHTGRLLAYDCETTGVDVHTDRIITAHTAYVGDGKPTLSQPWLINPGIPIPPAATAVHGITDVMVVADGQPPAGALEQVAAELCAAMAAGIPVVAYNAAYDLSMLEVELDRHGLPGLTDRLGRAVGPVIDPLVLDKHLDPYRKGSRKLLATAAHYRVSLAEADAHDAGADAMTAARIAYRIGQAGTGTGPEADQRWKAAGLDVKLRAAYRDLAAMTLVDLHHAQISWAEQQARSLAEYFTRTGKADAAAGVETGWPLWHPVLTAAAPGGDAP